VGKRRNPTLTFAGVIALLFAAAVLVVLLLPILSHIHPRALRAQCASNLHSLSLALIQYAMDYNHEFPAAPGVIKSTKDTPGIAPKGSGEESYGLLYDRYVPDANVFRCPTTTPRDPAELARPASGGRNLVLRNPSFRKNDLTSYAYDPRHTYEHEPGVAIVADRGGGAGINSPNHDGDGQNVLYVDGHVKWRANTNCGYGSDGGESRGGDEIYVRNDALRDKTHDSWLINSKGRTPEEAARAERARRRWTIALTVAAAVLGAAFLSFAALALARRLRRRRLERGGAPAESSASGDERKLVAGTHDEAGGEACDSRLVE